jgi:hypothetical protein
MKYLLSIICIYAINCGFCADQNVPVGEPDLPVITIKTSDKMNSYTINKTKSFEKAESVVTCYEKYIAEKGLINSVNIVGLGDESKSSVIDLFVLFIENENPVYPHVAGFVDKNGKFVDVKEEALNSLGKKYGIGAVKP